MEIGGRQNGPKKEDEVMRRFLTPLAVLVAIVLAAGNVWAAEAETEPAPAAMQEVNLEQAGADMEYEEDDGSGITLDFVINAIPAALLIDMSGNNFGFTTDATGARSTASSVYMMPNISAGIGANVSDSIYVDGMLGAGVLVNEALRSFFAQATISATFEASQSLNIGPRIGLIQFLGTEWLDDEPLVDEVDFDDSTGFMVGLQVVMGDRVRYLVNVDYITMDFDANVPAGITGDDENTFELEGLAVQFGVRGEF
jgi:hypothetical protein